MEEIVIVSFLGSLFFLGMFIFGPDSGQGWMG
jgi:hypothetical protein